jgi:transposase
MLPPVTDILKVLTTLNAEKETLQHIISEQRMEISRLNCRLGSKDREILKLKKENNLLLEQLSHYEKPTKDSHNSSISPSQEPIPGRELRRTVSLRKPSGRTSGGQPGHAGATLAQIPNPDRIVRHAPDYCRGCGRPLPDELSEPLGARQVTDLPEIQPVVTEHRIYGKQCSCGCYNRGTFPEEARSSACYGPNIRAMISYFHTVQCIPYERLSEVFRECFHVDFSQGTIKNILVSMQQASHGMYEQIRRRITQSPVVGADETGAHVEKKLHWIWGFQTDKLTYLYHDQARNKTAIDKYFPQGLPHSTLVTDRFAPYFKCFVKEHQLCLAHLLRELTWLCELDKNQNWSSRMKELFQEAIHKRKTMNWDSIPREDIFKRLDDLLLEPLYKLQQDFGRLQRSLLKHRDSIFRFLSNPDIPSDNNASERAIRLFKIKYKVSGCFRSDKGADMYTQLLSIADTAKKNGKSRFQALNLIAKEGYRESG